MYTREREGEGECRAGEQRQDEHSRCAGLRAASPDLPCDDPEREAHDPNDQEKREYYGFG